MSTSARIGRLSVFAAMGLRLASSITWSSDTATAEAGSSLISISADGISTLPDADADLGSASVFTSALTSSRMEGGRVSRSPSVLTRALACQSVRLSQEALPESSIFCSVRSDEFVFPVRLASDLTSPVRVEDRPLKRSSSPDGSISKGTKSAFTTTSSSAALPYSSGLMSVPPARRSALTTPSAFSPLERNG